MSAVERIKNFLAHHEHMAAIGGRPDEIYRLNAIPSDEPGVLLASDLQELLAELADAHAALRSSRYFVTYRGGVEVEVSKADYVNVERANGFHNTLGQPGEPATSGFSGRTASGRQEPRSWRGDVR